MIYLLSIIKRKTISDDTLIILVNKMRSLSKHISSILSGIINKDIIGFRKIQINLADSTCKIIKTLNFSIINFNNNENKFVNSTDVCINDVILDKFHVNGVMYL